jgi:hypothetical protein
MDLLNEPIPKKPCKDAKHCSLYKKHLGAHVTQNTVDYNKYERDGEMKKGFAKGQHSSMALNKKTPRLQCSRSQTRS